jgi:hypothetical protein
MTACSDTTSGQTASRRAKAGQQRTVICLALILCTPQHCQHNISFLFELLSASSLLLGQLSPLLSGRWANGYGRLRKHRFHALRLFLLAVY